MDYLNCFSNSCLKLMGFKVFEPKMYFDYEKNLAMGIYNNNILFVIKNSNNNNRRYILTNIVKVNDINYKVFFTDSYSHVLFISITKKSTYLWLEIVDLFFSYQKSLIIDSNHSKALHNFFDLSRNKQFINNIEDSILQEFINFLYFQDIYW
jgi:hypothetical protein